MTRLRKIAMTLITAATFSICASCAPAILGDPDSQITVLQPQGDSEPASLYIDEVIAKCRLTPDDLYMLNISQALIHPLSFPVTRHGNTCAAYRDYLTAVHDYFGDEPDFLLYNPAAFDWLRPDARGPLPSLDGIRLLTIQIGSGFTFSSVLVDFTKATIFTSNTRLSSNIYVNGDKSPLTDEDMTSIQHLTSDTLAPYPNLFSTDDHSSFVPINADQWELSVCAADGTLYRFGRGSTAPASLEPFRDTLWAMAHP